MLTWVILATVAGYSLYLLFRMVRHSISIQEKNCVNDPDKLLVYYKMFYGALVGSLLAFIVFALIQPDFYWAIFDPSKVSSRTQGMLDRKFFLLAGWLGAIGFGGIPGSVLGLLCFKKKSANVK